MPRTKPLGRPSWEYLLTTTEALSRTKVSRRTLYRYAALGLVTTWKVGSSNRYDVRELDALITRQSAA